MIVRLATLTDATTVAALHAESWRRTYREMLTDAFLDGPAREDRQRVWNDRLAHAAPDQFVCLIEQDGKAKAFTCALLDRDPHWGALLDNLHVSASAQGQGLGRRLMGDVAAWVVQERPRSKLHLWVLKPNVDAQRFYAHLGGVLAGEEMHTVADGNTMASLRYGWEHPRDLIGPAVTSVCDEAQRAVPFYEVRDLAEAFADALDHNDFDRAAHLLVPTCQYQTRDEGVLVGRDAIVASYRQHDTYAHGLLDRIEYSSSVEAVEGSMAVIRFNDLLEKAGQRHSYSCRQRLTFNNSGLIDSIQHEEIHAERMAMRAFMERVDLIR